VKLSTISKSTGSVAGDSRPAPPRKSAVPSTVGVRNGCPRSESSTRKPRRDRPGADHAGEEALGVDGRSGGRLAPSDRRARNPCLQGHDAPSLLDARSASQRRLGDLYARPNGSVKPGPAPRARCVT
jgi:hypothetical protein